MSFRDANFTNEEGAGKILAKIVGQSVVVGAETALRVEEKGAGADDTVDVQVGEVIILDADGFALRAWSDAIVNKAVTSNSSGNPRIDVVVAYVDKAVEDIGANNSPGGLVFAIVDGTPSGSPSPPNDATIQAAVGADNPFIKLAQIAVADSFVSIVDANITDVREQFSIQSGGKKLQYNVAINTWELEDSLTLENNKGLQGEDTGGTAQNLIKRNASNKTEVGLGEMAWERLGETILGAPADVITIASFPARRFLKILISIISDGGAMDMLLTFNNDTGANYARRVEISGVAPDVVDVNQNNISLGYTTDIQKFDVSDVVNIATLSKLLLSHNIQAAGSAAAPGRRETAGVWNNTSNQITRVDITNAQAGSYATGSKVIVLGHD